MKIGIILAKPPSYSETFFNSKIKGLLDYGHDVTLYVRDNSSSFSGCKVVLAPKVSKNPIVQIIKMVLVFVGLLFRFKRLQQFITLEKASGRRTKEIFRNTFINAHVLKANLDWIHFGFTTLAIDSEHVAESIGAKMAVSCRGYDMDVYSLKHKDCYDLVWKKVDKVHAISKYMLQKAYSHGLQIAVPSAIIFPAVNKALFENKNESDFRVPIKITTIARLHWIKGLDYTLEALAILKSKGVNFNYEIIGDGPEYESLRYAVHELDLEDSVSFIGKLSHSDTLGHLKNTDIYLQYSHSEGFCNAILEAQAMGCLCIVSDGGALAENVLHEKTGFVVPNRNAKALSETIFRVLEQDNLVLSQIKNASRTRVLNEFTTEQQRQAFIDFYE